MCFILICVGASVAELTGEEEEKGEKERKGRGGKSVTVGKKLTPTNEAANAIFCGPTRVNSAGKLENFPELPLLPPPTTITTGTRDSDTEDGRGRAIAMNRERRR